MSAAQDRVPGSARVRPSSSSWCGTNVVCRRRGAWKAVPQRRAATTGAEEQRIIETAGREFFATARKLLTVGLRPQGA